MAIDVLRLCELFKPFNSTESTTAWAAGTTTSCRTETDMMHVRWSPL